MRRFLILALCLMSIKLQSQEWVITYCDEEEVLLKAGSCNENGNYIFGVCDRNENTIITNAYAMFIENDGSYISRKFCYDYKSELCRSVTLDNGNAFVVGLKGGTLNDYVMDSLWIMIMTPELEVVEEHSYPFVAPYNTWTNDIYLDFDSDGNVIVLANVSEGVFPALTMCAYVVLKCDIHGNVLKTQYYPDGHGVSGAKPTCLIRVPNSDRMMLMGKAFNVLNYHSIAYIDGELNLVDSYMMPLQLSVWNYSDCWKDDSHFLMSSQVLCEGVMNSYYAAVFEVDDTGHYLDTLVYDRADTTDYTAQYGSMAYFNDEVIYITTYWEPGLAGKQNDVVMLMIDKNLNMLGLKRLMVQDAVIRPSHCQITHDGGCLVYGNGAKKDGYKSYVIWKLLPEDFVVPWTLTELPDVSQHHDAFPNPTSDKLNFILNDTDNQGIKVCISDINGRKYFEHRYEDCDGLLTIDVSKFENGTYVYEMLRDGKSIVKGRFIKN